MRKRFAGLALVASLAAGLLPSDGFAQQPKGGAPDKPKAGAPKKGDVIDLDADDADPKDPKKKKEAAAPEETPTPGQMTEEAAQAKRLFDGNKWPEAALALKRVTAG